MEKIRDSFGQLSKAAKNYEAIVLEENFADGIYEAEFTRLMYIPSKNRIVLVSNFADDDTTGHIRTGAV